MRISQNIFKQINEQSHRLCFIYSIIIFIKSFLLLLLLLLLFLYNLILQGG